MRSSQCWFNANDSIYQTTELLIPCRRTTTEEPVVNCCAEGDTCLSNHFCYNPQTYYISPCTDPTYESPVCPKYCHHRHDPYQFDVEYQAADGLWHCCIRSGPSLCLGFTNETFKAPAPSKLTFETTLPPAPSSSPTQGHRKVGSSTSLLNTNDKVGLGVGIPSAIIAILSLVIAVKTYKVRKAAERQDHLTKQEEGQGNEPLRGQNEINSANQGNGTNTEIPAASATAIRNGQEIQQAQSYDNGNDQDTSGPLTTIDADNDEKQQASMAEDETKVGIPATSTTRTKNDQEMQQSCVTDDGVNINLSEAPKIGARDDRVME